MVSAVPVRKLLLCGVIGLLLAASLPAWADGEADQIARAQQLIADKNYGDAVTVLVPITSSSDKPIARQAKEALEWCYRLSGEWDKAIPVLESLLRDYPADTPLWKARLGRCYRETGQSSKAIATMKEGLDFTPRAPALTEGLYQNLWMCYVVSDDWAGAVSTYQWLLQTRPEEAARWHYQLGRCYRKMGKNPEAIASLEKAIELAKGDREAIKQFELELTDACQNDKDLGKIGALFQRLEPICPGYSIARANELIGQKRYAVAEAVLTPIASSAGPNSREARAALEGCYRRAGQWDKAIPILESRLRESPEDTAALKSMIGRCYRGTREYSKAYEAIKEGLEFKPRTPAVTAALTENLRNWCIENQNWDVPTYLYRSLLTKQPEDAARWYCELSRCQQKLHRGVEAAQSIKKGLISAPRASDAKKALIVSLWDWCTECGNWDPAVSVFLSLLVEQPEEEAEWQYELGRCYRRMAKRAQATAPLEKALELAKGDSEATERIGIELWKNFRDAHQFHDEEALLTRLSAEYPRPDDFWRSKLRECRRNEADSIAVKAYAFLHSGEYANGAAAFQEAIQCSPDLGDLRNAHVCYVECLQGQGKTDEAWAYAKKLYDEHADWRDGALFVQGQLSFGSKNYDDAAAAFRRVIAEYPGSSYLQYCRPLLVAALQAAGRIDEAVETLRGTLAEDSDDGAKARTVLRVADVYYAAGKYRDSIAALKEVSSYRNAPAEVESEATYIAGLCYRAMGYASSARKCMDRLIGTGSDNRWARKARGQLYMWTLQPFPHTDADADGGLGGVGNVGLPEE